MLPYVGNIGTIGTNGITNGTIGKTLNGNCLPMVPFLPLEKTTNARRDMCIYSVTAHKYETNVKRKVKQPSNNKALSGGPLSIEVTVVAGGLEWPCIELYGDLVYKFKKLIGSNDFSFQFGKIITRYRRIGYNLNVMRQSACLVFNPITVDNYAAFFNCTPVGRASDSMMAPT